LLGLCPDELTSSKGASSTSLRSPTGRHGASRRRNRSGRGDEELRRAARELLARKRHERGDEPPHEPHELAILTDYYANQYGWTRERIETEDFWLIVRDYPESIRRREALKKLDDAYHQMLIRGPEGEQEVRNEKGNLVKGGNTVSFLGYQAYLRRLMGAAGLIDPEVEEIVEEQKRLDRKFTKIERFFGMAQQISGKKP